MAEPLKLWLLTRSDNPGFDQYHSAVVAASSLFNARHVHPRVLDDHWLKKIIWLGTKWGYLNARDRIDLDEENDRPAGRDWVHPDEIIVTEIGIATASLPDRSVVCSDYSAG